MNRRELWARNLALLTGVLVVVFAVLFALVQNPAPVPGVESKDSGASSMMPAEPVVFSSAQIATGRQVFAAQGCMRCHAVAGAGNPRLPLDGVGERRNADSIRQWIIAADELKDQMSPVIFQVKQPYRTLPADDLEALVIYLRSTSVVPE